MTDQHLVLRGIAQSMRSEELAEGGDDIEIPENPDRNITPRAPWKTGGVEQLREAFERRRKKKSKKK